MLEMATAPVTVLGYGQWTGDDKAPMQRKDGSPVEFVEFRVDGEERVRRITLDASVNGSRVEPGTVATLRLESRIEADATIGRDGRARVVYPHKFRVLAFGAVKS